MLSIKTGINYKNKNQILSISFQQKSGIIDL